MDQLTVFASITASAHYHRLEEKRLLVWVFFFGGGGGGHHRHNRSMINAARKDNNTADSAEDTNHTALYPEFLNSLTVQRLR